MSNPFSQMKDLYKLQKEAKERDHRKIGKDLKCCNLTLGNKSSNSE